MGVNEYGKDRLALEREKIATRYMQEEFESLSASISRAEKRPWR